MLNLNKEQKKAVKHNKGPLMIVAGAGTGKTTAITRRIAHLINQDYAEANEILAVTFTEKAAQEMEERVDGLLPENYLDLWISTFHSFCHRILEDYGLDIGLPGNFQVVDNTQAWLLVRDNLDKFDLDYYQPLGNPTRFIHALLGHFSRCKDEGIFPQDYQNHADNLQLNMDGIATGSKEVKSKDKKELAKKQEEADRVKEIASAYSTYQQLLLDNNKLDYGDLLNYTVKLFKKRPNILDKFQKQFKYVLVDEFQDTNWIQYQLIKMLSKPQDNLTVCADDDQSIFRFRGASFNNVLQFKDDYPQAEEVVLTKNYRSRQNILDTAYKFIQHNNPNRLEYQLSKVDEISQKAEEKGIDINKFQKIDKKLKAQKQGSAEINHKHLKAKKDEKVWIIKKIAQIYNQNKEVNLRDFAILARTNKQAQEFSRALEGEGIPAQFLSSSGLYSKPIILDITSYFKLLDNYHESSATYRVLNIPPFDIPEEDQALLTNYCRKKSISLYQALKQATSITGISEGTLPKINKILSMIKDHTKLAQRESVSEVFIAFLQDSGYLDYLTGETRKNQKSINYINQFHEKIQQFERSQTDPRLQNFLTQLEMELEAGEEGKLEFDPEAGPDSVKIMTIHSAKGLEFAYVFLPELVKRRFPTTKRKEPIEIPEELTKEVTPKGDFHLQEERRLFYVALTRAKKGLFVTSAEDYGGKRKKKPSRFLFEAEFLKGKNTPKPEKTSSELQIRTKRDKKPDQAPRYEIPSRFSYTQFAAFNTCPYQYKLGHILKVPKKGKASFTFGKTIHNTLYRFLRQATKNKKKEQTNLLGENNSTDKKENGAIYNRDELYSIYKEEWIDEWFESKAHEKKYFKKGKESLKLFLNDLKSNQPQIKTINGEPALEQDFYINIGGETVKGKIDRIDKAESGKVELIDYKTGNPKDRLKKDQKEQLLLYQIAAEDVFNLEPKRLTYYYLQDGTRLSFLGEAEDKKQLIEKYSELIEEIKNSNFEATPGWHCKFCDYYNICDYRREF